MYTPLAPSGRLAPLKLCSKPQIGPNDAMQVGRRPPRLLLLLLALLQAPQVLLLLALLQALLLAAPLLLQYQHYCWRRC